MPCEPVFNKGKLVGWMCRRGREKQKPLTLEQLREMEGRPVYNCMVQQRMGVLNVETSHENGHK